MVMDGVLNHSDIWDATVALRSDVVVLRNLTNGDIPLDDPIFDPDPSLEDLPPGVWNPIHGLADESELDDLPDDHNPWTVLGPAPPLTDLPST